MSNITRKTRRQSQRAELRAIANAARAEQNRRILSIQAEAAKRGTPISRRAVRALLGKPGVGTRLLATAAGMEREAAPIVIGTDVEIDRAVGEPIIPNTSDP
jgi:hypothetical protein